jgi:hypothetical protein
MASGQTFSPTTSGVQRGESSAVATVQRTLAWLATKPALIFLVWSFWLAAEYLVFGSSSYVRIHDNGDATLPMLLAHVPPHGLPWNFLALCGLDGWAWGIQLTNVVFYFLPGWLAYGLFTWAQRFIAGYFMHRLLKDTLNLSLLPGLFAGLVYSLFSQPSNNASWAGFTLYDTLGLPGLPLLIWTLYRLMNSGGWWWLPGGLLLGMAFGICSPYAFAPFIFMACVSWVFLAPPQKPLRLLLLAGLLIFGCALVNFPTLWASSSNAPLSHRAAWTPNPAQARSWLGNLQFGWGFVADNALPLTLGGLGLALSAKSNRRLKILASFLALAVLFVIGYESLMALVQGHLGFLAGFQFSRVYLIIPFLAAVAAAVGLESLPPEWKFSAMHEDRPRWKMSLASTVFSFATIVLLAQSIAVKNKTLTELAGGANYATLYQNPELRELAQTIKSQPPCRIATVASQSDPAWHPGFAWAYGIETVDGYANLYPKRYQNYWEAVIGPLIKADSDRYDYFHYWGNRVYLFAPTGGFPGSAGVRFQDYYRLELLSLANVRYLVSTRPLGDERLSLLPSADRDAQLKWAAQSKTKKMFSLLRGVNPGTPLYVYENRAVLPRYSLVGSVKVFADKTELLTALGTASYAELKFTVYLDPAAATNAPAQLSAANADSVTLLQQTSAKVRLEVTNTSAAILVAANLYNPNWKATVDGQPAKIFPANEAFQGISLTAGHHQVELRYEPPYAFKN